MAGYKFRTDHTPTIGAIEQLEPDIQAITAPNAGPMTFTGTQTYILGDANVAVIDPGPDDPAHEQALDQALRGRRVEAIIVTHSHIDHTPLARRLARSTGAPVYGFGAHNTLPNPVSKSLGELGGGEGIHGSFSPDITVEDGEDISGQGWSVKAVHTPGHLSDHIALASGDRLFSGDHVMGWATTLISPPDGDLGAFMASLETCLRRDDRVYYPGHGAPVSDPMACVTHIRDHRRAREAQILDALSSAPQSISDLTQRLYADIDPRLHPAAARNVLAHIIELYQNHRVDAAGGFSTTAVFSLME